jgi:hypothetical protein
MDYSKTIPEALEYLFLLHGKINDRKAEMAYY